MAVAKLGGQQPAGPVGDAKVLGWWRQGGGQDLSAPVAADRLWAAETGSASRPVNPWRAYRLRQAITVGREMPSRSAISVVETLRRPAAGSWPVGPAQPGPGRRWPSAARPQARPGQGQRRQQ